MAGRPTKVYTIEDIEAKLEPWALSYLYIPEHEARREFLVSERASLLTKSQVFTELPQNEYAETLVQISIQGQAHPKFLELPDTVKEKFFALEGLLTPKEFKLRRAFRAYYHPKEGEEKQAEYFLGGIYRATKFINLYYKWVLTPPSNGRPNFYSCFTAEAYPYEIQKLFKDNLVMNCDMMVHFSDFSARNDTLKSMRIPKKQEEIFDFIKKRILIFVNSCNRNKPYEPTKNKPPYFWLNLIELEDTQFIDEIAQALEAVTLEDVTTRPSTRKENETPLFTGIPKAFETGGYYPLLEEMDKQSEKDAQIDPFSNHKVYKSPHSRVTIECDLSQGEIKKNVAVSKVTNTITFLANQNRDTVQATCEMEIGKIDYLRYMKLTEEQIKDPVYRKNFFARQLKPFAFLRSMTWTIKDGKGRGRVGGILDYAEINSKTVKFRFNKEFMQSVFLGFSPTPRTLESNKIPDIYPIEYYLQNKLENLFTNLRRQETNKNDIRQLKPLLEYLEQRGLLSQNETRYKEKLCNRIIKALDYLQNENKSIEYYLCATPDGPALEGEELEKYKNRNNFPNLYLWFSVPLLEEYIDPEQAKAIRKRIAEKKAKRKERQERAKDRKLGELEAERLDRAKEQAEAEAKAQNEQPKVKTLTDYFNQGNQ